MESSKKGVYDLHTIAFKCLIIHNTIVWQNSKVVKKSLSSNL